MNDQCYSLSGSNLIKRASRPIKNSEEKRPITDKHGKAVALAAHLRMVYFVGCLIATVILFAGIINLAEAIELPGWLLAALCFGIMIGGIISALYAMRGGMCKCPSCKQRTARFAYERDTEFLTCKNCELHEKTGYTLGD